MFKFIICLYRVYDEIGNYNSNGQKSVLKMSESNGNHVEKTSELKKSDQNKNNNSDNNSDCRGHVSQIFYMDSASRCKSIRRIRHLTCSGECSPASQVYRSLDEDSGFDSKASLFIGTNLKSVKTRAASCCRPSKFRVRKIKLLCPDGSSLVKEIEVARRCVCSSAC